MVNSKITTNKEKGKLKKLIYDNQRKQKNDTYQSWGSWIHEGILIKMTHTKKLKRSNQT